MRGIASFDTGEADDMAKALSRKFVGRVHVDRDLNYRTSLQAHLALAAPIEALFRRRSSFTSACAVHYSR